ncbi:GGDEF domain-containing protein [Reinekea thalattae]|uniref:diguanylate cyclase n=1 Tax=Reinekea thalattae TaxID=2593301 RepID=A0A5C8Z8F7_9GAMM|nr:GGDEF domain-containing protein [Reinekea thalattae]TXR53136.1 GGDEF domain-containing protein [Reinekea thalattae]
MANGFTQINFGTSKSGSSTPKMAEVQPISLESLTAEDLKDFRFQLSSQLQTTLEVDQLINILYRHLNKIVNVSGINYRCKQPSIETAAGRSQKHRCSYQLSMSKINYGEIIFTRSRRFSEKELSTIESIMDVVIFPIKNALKYQEAMTTAMIDPLTGLSNRGAMSVALTREIERARRHSDQSMSIVVVDIDHFKAINDRYGHLVGDSVLRTVAQIIQTTIRGCDACFRWGGEEFLICLSNSTASLAQVVSERIRVAIAKTAFLPDKERRITASFGIAHYDGESDWPELVERADDAMYQAKTQGRNQTVTSLVGNVHSDLA